MVFYYDKYCWIIFFLISDQIIFKSFALKRNRNSVENGIQKIVTNYDKNVISTQKVDDGIIYSIVDCVLNANNQKQHLLTAQGNKCSLGKFMSFKFN